MRIAVREMALDEVKLVVDYFHHSTPEHLEMLGVDPSRLPLPDAWHGLLEQDFVRPIEKRLRFYVIWLADDRAVGFSSCDKIEFGERANMHLHVTVPEHRQQGIGVACVRQSVRVYFEKLKLKKLYCEPNAFNVGQL
jgi:RimJ/RimL family protein N-acetyltransferase